MKRSGFDGFNLNRYYCLRTGEGNGVLHIIYWAGEFIPIGWLRQNWYDIIGAFEADIRKVWTKKNRVNGLVGYLLDRYLMNQNVKRMSYGWRWAWLGFCKSWKRVREHYGQMRKGTKELKTGHIHRQAARAMYTINHFISGRSMFKNQMLPAWQCTLWKYPRTSRKVKLCGGKTLKWDWRSWLSDERLEKADKPIIRKNFSNIGHYADALLNSRSRLYDNTEPDCYFNTK